MIAPVVTANLLEVDVDGSASDSNEAVLRRRSVSMR